jgi:hypothetical protein
MPTDVEIGGKNQNIANFKTLSYMSRTRKYNADTMSVMDRFFIAVEACVKAKIVKNTRAYCAEIGIESNHFYIQRKERTRGYFEVGWVVPLIRDYGISPKWLLTGIGTMFA